MLDVHPPHQPIHTWKEYLLHMSTIVLGLLIAIGLEQSAEWLHHLNQRHQLEADLGTEMQRDQEYATADLVTDEKVISWLLQIQRGVDAERATGGKAPFVYPDRIDGAPGTAARLIHNHLLTTEAWNTGKESDEVELLPREESEIYSRLFLYVDRVTATRSAYQDTATAQNVFEMRFSKGSEPPVFDVSRLTPGQLDEYEAILMKELDALRMADFRLRMFSAADAYVLAGGESEDGMRNAAMKDAEKR